MMHLLFVITKMNYGNVIINMHYGNVIINMNYSKNIEINITYSFISFISYNNDP